MELARATIPGVYGSRGRGATARLRRTHELPARVRAVATSTARRPAEPLGTARDRIHRHLRTLARGSPAPLEEWGRGCPGCRRSSRPIHQHDEPVRNADELHHVEEKPSQPRE